MYLALQVTSSHAAALGQNASKVFTEAGGTIGRVDGNDWVLPDDDRFVSGLHVLIRFMGGTFSIEDVSTNGTFLNDDPEPLNAKNEPAILKSGDRIAIGDYQVYVNIVQSDDEAEIPQPSAAPDSPDLLDEAGGMTAPGSVPAPAVTPAPAPIIPDDPIDIETVDPLDLLGDSAPEPAPATPSVSNHSSALHDSFIPPDTPSAPTPAPSSSGDAIPDDWEMTGFFKPEASTPQPAVIPPDAPLDDDFDAPDAAAPPPVPPPVAAPPPAAAPTAGRATAAGDALYAAMMPMIVQGMMEVLASRSEVKSEFRLAVTTIKPVDNNPLKFSPSPDIAMEQLFSDPQPGYLTAQEAFEEAFGDIKAHQLAMIAGMRAAFEHMLKQFSPDVLEERFESAAKKGSFMGIASKARYWEMYRDFFERLTADSDDNFRRLFGEEFAEAYEKQMQRLTQR